MFICDRQKIDLFYSCGENNSSKLVERHQEEMTEESSVDSHLTLDVTTMDMTQSTTSSGSSGLGFYFNCAVIVIGVIGMAINGLILYAMLAAKQHKKNVLIFHQNVFDFVSCILLAIAFSLRLCTFHLTGSAGYWLCTLLLSNFLLSSTLSGSVINLAMVTVERYLRVVYPVWSKTKIKKWMINLAMAFAWIGPIIHNLAHMFPTTAVRHGRCIAYFFYASEAAKQTAFYYHLLSYYVIILLIFVFCYWRILVVIRRQARVMAGHGASGSSGAEAQMNQMQNNVIKTMLYVSVFYAISYLPRYTYAFLQSMAVNTTAPGITYYVATIITFLYICANPFVYATKFSPVKQVLLQLIPCKRTTEQANANVDTGLGQGRRGISAPTT